MPSASGRLVVLDRAGRAVKQFPLAAGAATLGRDAACDIRVLKPDVWPQHALVVVHANQTVVRNVCGGETRVNGQAVSVAALRHGDVISLSDRSLRWLYDEPRAVRPPRPLAPMPALAVRGGRGRRGARRVTAAGTGGAAGDAAAASRALHLHHRASMPGNAGGKQVAVVQPQRRDTSDQIDVRSPPRGRRTESSLPASPQLSPEPPLRYNANDLSHDTTKATLWIESRKRSPRRSTQRPAPPSPAPAAASSAPSPASPAPRPPRPARTPLRLTVLRKAQSAGKHRVTKIQAPLKIDHMKQAALMLMTGRSRQSAPALLVPRPSPLSSLKRHSARKSTGKSLSVLEINDSVLQNSTATPNTSRRSKVSPLGSPLLPSPKKSAMRDPKAKRGTRKTESIKFDLSNLEPHQESDILLLNDTTKQDSLKTADSMTDEDLTLHYSDTSSATSPSPRRSIHSSRTSKMMEQAGSPMKTQDSTRLTFTPESPRSRKSLRGSIILQKALDDSSRYSRRTTKTLTDQSWDTTVESAFHTRTLSPRTSGQNLEAYSIVDLVSVDSNETGQSASVYDSVGSTRSSSIVFGTPQSRRKTRSTIDPSLLTSSTPYVQKGRVSTRSNSSPNISTRKPSPDKSRRSGSRRSQSLTTPENSEETKKHISINSTKISRASRSRSRINDSDLQFINMLGDGDNDESPRTSRRGSKLSKSLVQKTSSPQKASPVKSPSSSQKSSPRKTSSLPSSPRNASSKNLSPKNRSSPKTSPRNSIRVSQKTSPRKTISDSQNTSLADTSFDNLNVRSSSSQTSSPRNTSQRSSPRNAFQNSSVRSTRSQNSSPKIPSQKSSPRNSSQKSSPKNSSRKKSSNFTERRSRYNLTLDVSQPTQHEEGTTTPENRITPEDVGTPVLSIQSLLDSSQSSFASYRSPKQTRPSINIKRKTIGALRSNKRPKSSLKSKSFTASVRKSLRSLRLSKEADMSQTEEETVTPKSEVKLVQEGVKNKHSTARKPQSKRSIIDNLNESDIVKQLFNSPVKRKLSQSMTEFSRKKLFDDDDDEVARRPTRNTIAVSGRTPDDSLILDHTERYTPEHFVSPLSTPGNSPNLSGIRRLYAQNTPENDLRNVKGVKALLRTPRTRKSVKNDLTNIAGVKAIFAKSPKNRLSDVRVKEIFAPSPRNDLRRVSGVKTLFKQTRKQKSPANDLTDVRGVRALYTRKSAANDLRNVSGVKKTFARSPRNDLSDVRGVKRVFRQEKEPEYHDVSGIEELFNESNTSHIDSEALFDQLVGKPPIKAVYSKSFVTKRSKPKKQARKSLHTSIDLITNDVEGWLQQELQKRLHKDKLDQSTKANVSRELAKLATDTVEGNEMRTSRVRDSTLARSEGCSLRRSAAAVYSAHTLPLKKRSLNRSDNSKTELSTVHINLPIKKRAVVHSTPVKGRYNFTMNASELGRVSPIAVVDKTQTVEANRSKAKVSASPKGKRATRTNVLQEPEIIAISESPKAKGRRATKAKDDKKATTSPKQKRATRGRNVTDNNELPVKTTRGNRTKKNTESEEVGPSPKAKRNTKVEEPKSPKSLKAKGKKSSNITENAVPEPRTRRTRNNTDREGQNQDKPEPKNKRGSKAKAVEVIPSPKKTRATKATIASPKKAEGSPAKSRSLRNRTETEVTNTKRRRQSLVISKKAPGMEPKPAGRAARYNQKEDERKTPQKVEKKSTRRQKAAVEETPKSSPKRTRAKLVVAKPSPKLKPQAKKSTTDSDSDQKGSPKKGRSTRMTENVETEKLGGKRGRKAESSPQKSPVVAKRGRRNAAMSPPKSPAAKKGTENEPPAKCGRKANVSAIKMPSPKKTRGNNYQQSLPANTNRRTKTEPAEPPQKSRKRKSDEVIELPAKIPKTRGRKTAEVSEAIKSPAKAKNEAAKTKKSPVKTKVVASKAKKSPAKKKPASPKKTEGARSKRNTTEVQNKSAKTEKNTKSVKAKASPKKPVEKKTRGKKVPESLSPAAPRSKRSTKVSSSPAKAVKNTRSKRR